MAPCAGRRRCNYASEAIIFDANAFPILNDLDASRRAEADHFDCVYLSEVIGSDESLARRAAAVRSPG
jgi:hypothetical protein